MPSDAQMRFDASIPIINTTGSVSIGTTASDARLKDVGHPFKRELEDLEKIQPRHYRYSMDNALKLRSNREHIGLIVQDVQAAIPEAIDANNTGYLHVNNDPILWTKLNGIKELKRSLDEHRLRTRI